MKPIAVNLLERRVGTLAPHISLGVIEFLEKEVLMNVYNNSGDQVLQLSFTHDNSENYLSRFDENRLTNWVIGSLSDYNISKEKSVLGSCKYSLYYRDKDEVFAALIPGTYLYRLFRDSLK
jgi:hypothetical protein